MSRAFLRKKPLQSQSQEKTIVEEIELKECENETQEMKADTVQQEVEHIQIQDAAAVDAGDKPVPPQLTRRTTSRTSPVNVAATVQKEVVSAKKQPYSEPVQQEAEHIQIQDAAAVDAGDKPVPPQLTRRTASRTSPVNVAVTVQKEVVSAKKQPYREPALLRNTGAMARAPEIDLRHLIKAGPATKKVGITFNTIQTDVALEKQYRCYRESVDKERGVQTLLKEIYGVDTSTSAELAECSRAVKIPTETQTSKIKFSKVHIVESVVSEVPMTSGSSMKSLETRTDLMDKGRILEEFDVPCICRRGVPPRPLAIRTSSYIPKRPETFPMDYWTLMFFILFFLLKCFLMLLVWLLLLYGFIRTCGFYFVRLEVYENYNLNTYIDTEHGPKNYIINNSKSYAKLAVALDGPLREESTSNTDYFYYQFERWYYFKNNFTPTALKRPDWTGEPLRYTITDQQQPTLWLIEVEHYSRIMTYQWTNLSTTSTRGWYSKREFFTETYTRSSWTDFYRINYHARHRYRWYLARKHALYDYNFNRFTGLQELSYDFPDFRRVPGRSALYHDYRGTQPGPPQDVILANGTADDELTFIYVFRYSLNDVIPVRNVSNGTTKPSKDQSETKIEDKSETKIEDKSEDKSKDKSKEKSEKKTEDESKKLSKRQSKNKNNTKDDNVIVPFTLRLLRGTDKRYTTTTTTQPPPNIVKGSTGVQYLCGLISCALFLLLLQADMMSILVLMGAATISLVSYLEIREPREMEKCMYDIDEVLMLMYFMLLVQFLADTGFYGYVANNLRMLIGNYKSIAIYLCASSAVMTMLLTNSIVTMLLLTPLAIRCTEEFDFNPVPLLIMMIVYTNQAGILTPSSSYTNMRLWRHKESFPVKQVFKTATEFLLNFFLMYLVITVITTIYFALIFVKLKPHHYLSKRFAALTIEKKLWYRMRSAISPLSTNNIAIRKEIDREIYILERKIAREEGRTRASLDDPVRLQKENLLREPWKLLKVGLAFLFYLIMKALQSADVCLYKMDPDTMQRKGCFNKLSNGFVLWFSMGVLLILIHPNWNRTMARIDWATIVVFACLLLTQYLVSATNISEFFLTLVNPDTPTESLTSSSVTKMFWYSSISAALLNSVVALTVWLEYAISTYQVVGPSDNIMKLFTAILTHAMNIGGSALLLGTPAAIACHNSARQQGYYIGYFRYMLYSLPITALNLGILYLYYVMMSDEKLRKLAEDQEPLIGGPTS